MAPYDGDDDTPWCEGVSVVAPIVTVCVDVCELVCLPLCLYLYLSLKFGVDSTCGRAEPDPESL